jgi:hypothetical protein
MKIIFLVIFNKNLFDQLNHFQKLVYFMFKNMQPTRGASIKQKQNKECSGLQHISAQTVKVLLLIKANFCTL